MDCSEFGGWVRNWGARTWYFAVIGLRCKALARVLRPQKRLEMETLGFNSQMDSSPRRGSSHEVAENREVSGGSCTISGEFEQAAFAVESRDGRVSRVNWGGAAEPSLRTHRLV